MFYFIIFCIIFCLGSQHAACGSVTGYVYRKEVGAWLRLHTKPDAWVDAKARCQVEGGTLASPTTTAAAQVMTTMMTEHNISLSFTGINSKNNYMSLEGVPFSDIPLNQAAGQSANEIVSDDECMALTNAGALADVSCSSALQYFCRKESVSKCDSQNNGTQCAVGRSGSGHVYSRDLDLEASTLQLRLHTEPTTWADAVTTCNLEGGVLASPTTDAISRMMVAMMAEHQLMRSVFTGINSFLSAGSFRYLDGVSLANIPVGWAPGEPDNRNSDEECVVLTGAGALADVSCENALPYFCRKESARKCGSKYNGYEYSHRTGSCYKFHRVARTWIQAGASCRAEGGHLAIINSYTESSVLSDIFKENPADSITGAYLSYYALIGFTKFDDNTTITLFGQSLTDVGFETWAEGEPNNHLEPENCGSIHQNGLLNDCKCNKEYPYICERT